MNFDLYFTITMIKWEGKAFRNPIGSLNVFIAVKVCLFLLNRNRKYLLGRKNVSITPADVAEVHKNMAQKSIPILNNFIKFLYFFT